MNKNSKLKLIQGAARSDSAAQEPVNPLPCRYCNRGDLVKAIKKAPNHEGLDNWQVVCGHCGARGPDDFDSEAKAICEWNRVAQQPAITRESVELAGTSIDEAGLELGYIGATIELLLNAFRESTIPSDPDCPREEIEEALDVPYETIITSFYAIQKHAENVRDYISKAHTTAWNAAHRSSGVQS